MQEYNKINNKKRSTSYEHLNKKSYKIYIRSKSKWKKYYRSYQQYLYLL